MQLGSETLPETADWLPSRPLLVLLLVLSAASIVTGCASPLPADPQAMAARQTAIVKSHRASVQVQISGGRETAGGAPSQISDSAFAEALVASIESGELFTEVLSSGRARYTLAVRLSPLEQPSTGFAMTVRMRARWRLVDNHNGALIWERWIESSHTASAIASRKAVTRIRLATEGAARSNIEQGLARLSRLNLS